MTKLTAVATCLVLLMAAPGFASGADPDLRISDDALDGPTVGSPAYPAHHDTGPTVLDALEMKAVSGTGAVTDFGCGFATGAGFILTVSGVAAPLGLALAGASLVCAIVL